MEKELEALERKFRLLYGENCDRISLPSGDTNDRRFIYDQQDYGKCVRLEKRKKEIKNIVENK